jgi:hypothetical protein
MELFIFIYIVRDKEPKERIKPYNRPSPTRGMGIVIDPKAMIRVFMTPIINIVVGIERISPDIIGTAYEPIIIFVISLFLYPMVLSIEMFFLFSSTILIPIIILKPMEIERTTDKIIHTLVETNLAELSKEYEETDFTSTPEVNKEE